MSNYTTRSMAAKAEFTAQKLSDTEFRKLLSLSQAGNEEARNKLLLANMGLIYKIANQVKNPNADMDDLVADGCIRFLEIINGYNPDVASLSTYIWKPLLQYMNNGVVDFKPGLAKFITTYNETKTYLAGLNQRIPTQEEIARNMGISVKVLKARLNDIEERSRISLETPMDSEDSESTTLADSYICATSYDASTDLIRKDEQRCIKLAWNRLSDSEKEVLMFRMAGDGKKLSLRGAAKKAGISAETIRLRELAAKNHLKAILQEYAIQVA